jgi:UDP-GlcNAc:undecaprenyl-phosphate GlcNAc-1-phosphate transferase
VRIVFYILVAVISGAVTFAMSIVIWKLSMRFRLYPKIRERDMHTRPTPKLGGVAIFIGIVVAFGVGALLPPFQLVFSQPGQVLAVLGAALMVFLIGVADDIWDIDWITRLAGQFVAAGLVAWQGVQLLAIPVPGSLVLLSPYMSLVISALAIVVVMNAINFLDGLDGLVAGVVLIASSVFFVYSYLISTGPTGQSDYFNLAQFITAALIGACAGFLPLNFRRGDAKPARLFMGGGTYVVGLLMAASTLAVTGQIDPEAGGRELLPAFIPILLPFAVLIVPLLDFGFAVLRRMRAGKSPFSADRKHLHHRLVDMGHSTVHAVLILYAWTAVASVGCLLTLFTPWWLAVIVTVVGLLICTSITLAPLSRRKAVEAAVQSASPELAADAGVADFDPLDSAADVLDTEVDRSAEDAALALDKLQKETE